MGKWVESVRIARQAPDTVRGHHRGFNVLMLADVAGLFLTATSIPRNKGTADTLRDNYARNQYLIATTALLAGLALAPGGSRTNCR